MAYDATFKFKIFFKLLSGMKLHEVYLETRELYIHTYIISNFFWTVGALKTARNHLFLGTNFSHQEMRLELAHRRRCMSKQRSIIKNLLQLTSLKSTFGALFSRQGRLSKKKSSKICLAGWSITRHSRGVCYLKILFNHWKS